MSTYSTRDEAIEREIVVPIEATGVATRDEYDIDAIADEVLGGAGDGYALTVDTDGFWAAVEKHAR
jgi:hypothetical protein